MMWRFTRPQSPRRPRCPSSVDSSDFSSSFSRTSLATEATGEGQDNRDSDCSSRYQPSLSEWTCTGGEISRLSTLEDFTLIELKTATGSFSTRSLIDSYNDGRFFRGRLTMQSYASSPNSSILVDIKELRPMDVLDHEEWVTVLHYLNRLRHPHLVKLLGFSSYNFGFLVHESLAGRTLADCLFHYGTSWRPLSWYMRTNIAIGVAKALSFLHDTKIQVIHGNVRASNVLLDSEFNPKLSDFSSAIAKTIGNKTDASGRILGCRAYGSSPGQGLDAYSAPDYLETGNMSLESDIYSFGVVLLELLSGRPSFDSTKPPEERKLVQWAKSYFNDDQKLSIILDPIFKDRYPVEGAHTMMKLALSCTMFQAKYRPNMHLVLRELEEIYDQQDQEPNQAVATFS